MERLRKYIVQYYGWIGGYGDFDVDDFIVRAPNLKEAKVIMNDRLKKVLLKGKPSIMLYSTFVKKMNEWNNKQTSIK